MNTAFVFNACSPLFPKEINELNHFQQTYIQQDAIQAWVISRECDELPKPALQIAMSEIKLVQVRDETDEEEILAALLQVYQQEMPDCVIFPSTLSGTSLVVRFSVRSGGTSCMSVTVRESTSEGLIINKSVYANNLTASFRMKRKPYCFSVAKIAIRKEWQNIEHTVTIMEPIIPNDRNSHVLSYEFHQIETGEPLDSAEKVLALGKGVKKQEHLHELEKAANQIGLEIGVTRPIAMNGWTDMGRLIGASGKLLSPRLCIAAGVSGSQAFTVGIRDSRFIVSINQDEYAPIHKIADVAIIDDYQEVLKALFPLMEQQTVEGV
ncbi:electron transfer flavoprotein subunit alpha/FixB family protein [Bacillus sp. DNRA2]|uniref:electron transfer flavoprotein subunit alpha/FixB family protein n=1 Tax=Bacillus sp. DNRA2 TaxID=2723053 RepID=UPI00145EB73B|nr:electron transfer flavoprotein subunit alpha/FixB family protein [Bacillus sp. DNRA2]NMD71550.1 electron transfer flavoprotein subunit alpha/FixB family protein [Bacillus sp. DNRA2]